jgi:hypothetical protein
MLIAAPSHGSVINQVLPAANEIPSSHLQTAVDPNSISPRSLPQRQMPTVPLRGK